MPICNVTGVVYSPSGAPIGATRVTFKPVERNITDWSVGAVVPYPVATRSDSDGRIDVDLIPGGYTIIVQDWHGWANVPDAATADVADVMQETAPPSPTPPWVERIEDLVADAEAAAEAAADDVRAEVQGDVAAAEAARTQSQAAAAEAATNAGFLPAQIAMLRQNDIAHVMQSAATLPPRPPRALVYWHTWDDPSGVMQDPDVWLQLPVPVVPPQPTSDMWDAVRTRVSGEIAIRLNYIPNAVPSLLQMRYRVNGGAWSAGVPAVRGYTIINGRTDGTEYNIQIAFQNYIGWGAVSGSKTVTPSVATEEVDTFDRPDGTLLSTVPAWGTKNGVDLVHQANGVQRSISGAGTNPYGGQVIPSVGMGIHRGYFTNAQWVECQYESVGVNLIYGPGVFLQADEQLERGSQGYAIIQKPNRARVFKNIDGAWQFLGDITHATVAAPQTIRYEYNGSGVITVRNAVTSTVLGTFTDLSGTGFPTFGRPGIQSSWPSTATAASARILNFRAGNI